MNASNMWLLSLDSTMHARTCGYWYTVTQSGTPHTAFRTAKGLYRWMEERGLTLDGDLPPLGEYKSLNIVGEYENRMVTTDQYAAITPQTTTRKLDNAQYTEAKITEENGHKVVTYINCNWPRPVFDYCVSSEMMS